MFVLPVFGLSHKGGLHEPSLPEAVWPVRELRRGVVSPFCWAQRVLRFLPKCFEPAVMCLVPFVVSQDSYT